MDDRGHLDHITWWGFHGGDSIHLSTLATRLLSQVASSSSAERNLSTYGFIHSVKRNRLGAAKAEDLVYVHSNLRLLSHVEPEYKKGPSRMWDEPEISDLNLTLNAMTHLNLIEDIVPPPVPTDATSYIPGPSSSIHDVELQYAEDNVDPFEDM